MKRYVYVIEVQKPSGASRFLKAFETPLIIDSVEINERNQFFQKLFDDRVENYSYLATIDVDIWPDLIEAYKDLVRRKHLSLEYTKDDYVYLIPKKGKRVGVKIAHPLVRKLTYKKPEPIPFYPEKKPRDDGTVDPSSVSQGFYCEKYFLRFTDRVKSLLFFHNGRHSVPYITMEAFILTYGEYFATIKKFFPPPTSLTYFLLKEEWLPPTQFPTIKALCRNLVASPLTYDLYVAPTYEGRANVIGADGKFYCALDNAKAIYQVFETFLKAADNWADSKLEAQN